MKIEKGKFYRTRGGLKVEIYSTDNPGSHPIHGRIFRDSNPLLMTWMLDGKPVQYLCHAYDLISEWNDEPPKLDLTTLPRWRYVAMDADGTWWVYAVEPKRYFQDKWSAAQPRKGYANISAKWSGDWRESLHEIMEDGTLKKVTD